MAKSSVILAAALMVGATAIISPVQAAVLGQQSTQAKTEDNQTLVARRDRFRGRRYCWRSYGRIRCKGRYDNRNHRWRNRNWRNRREREREEARRRQIRQWRKRQRWEDREWRKRRRWEDRNWRNNRRNRDYEIWRSRDRRGNFDRKLERWLDRKVRNDDD